MTEENLFYTFWKWTTHDPVAFYTSVLALFTFVLSASTIGLWWVTWRSGIRQSKDMEKTIRAAVTSYQVAVTNSEQQLRAYITAKEINLVTHRHPGRMSPIGNVVLDGPIHTYGLAAILRNGGQTPATNIVINVSCQRLPTELREDFTFPDSNLFGHGLIGPDSEIHTPTIRINAADFEAIGDGYEWYLWGWIEYDDIFTRSGSTARHRTEFCFKSERIRLQPTNELWVGFKHYVRFNAADWDCLRPIDPMTHESGPRR